MVIASGCGSESDRIRFILVGSGVFGLDPEQLSSVVDPNTLYLDLDPDPSHFTWLHKQF